MDARDLVLQKNISEYWKKNHMFEEPYEQLRLVLRSYDTLKNKIEYLKELDCRELIGKDEYDQYPVEKIIDYYTSLLQEIYSPNANGIVKTFIITNKYGISLPESELFDAYNNSSIKSTSYSLYELFEYYREDRHLFEADTVVTCLMYDTNRQQQIKEFEIFMIKNKVSMILEYEYDPESRTSSCTNNEFLDYLYDVTGLYYYTNKQFIPLYPFKDGTKVSIQTNNMKEPIIRNIQTDIDENGTNYIYLGDHSSFEDIRKDPNRIFISENIFQHFYNYYDWMKGVE